MSKHRSRPGGPGGGFTLVELLVVILIILVLAGILFRTIKYVMSHMARSRTVACLEQLQNALNEYYAEYGFYPPVDFVEYEFESATNQTPWFRQVFLPAHNNPQASDFFADAAERQKVSGWSLGYRYGLVSYLWGRGQGDQRHWYDADTARDTAAKSRWAHFLDDRTEVPMGSGLVGHPSPPGVQSQAAYSNEVLWVEDGWGHEVQYRSDPPYTSYRLWSVGPDGVDGTSDDVRKDTWNE